MSLVVLLSLFACKKGGDDTGSFVDADNDGYDSLDDCDDNNPDINPGADELCNQIDDNCNDLVDDDATDALTWYIDGDADGFGGDEVLACDAPADGVEIGGDCDDTVDTINPDGVEVCNDADDDCNDLVDDEPTDGTTYWTDADADGFGDPESPVLACALEDGLSDNDQDCNDASELAAPGLEEVCNDALDNDCDGTDNGCGALGEVSLADADITWLGSNAGDKLGGPARSVSDLDGDGHVDIALSARGYDNGKGAVFLVDGPYTAGDQDVETESVASVVGESDGDALFGVTGIGDFNSDGRNDFAVSSKINGTNGDKAGTVYLFYGVPTEQVSATSAQVQIWGDSAGDELGVLSGPQDIDNDGVPDIVTTAYKANSNAGKAYLIPGGLASDGTATESASLVVSGTTDARLGGGLSVTPDLDGDGIADFILGAPYDDDGGDKAGAVYVIAGAEDLPPAMADTDLTVKLTGSNGNDQVGWGIGPGGDQNGDGHEDLLVSATRSDLGASVGGAVYLVPGPITGGDLDTINLAVFTGESDNDRMAPSFGGDVNRDGQPDVIVASRNHAPGGSAYLFLGPVSGTNAAADADAIWSGLSDGDGAGSPINIPGDLDGDGHNDLLIGARDADTSVGTDAGAAYLIFGQGL